MGPGANEQHIPNQDLAIGSVITGNDKLEPRTKLLKSTQIRSIVVIDRNDELPLIFLNALNGINPTNDRAATRANVDTLVLKGRGTHARSVTNTDIDHLLSTLPVSLVDLKVRNAMAAELLTTTIVRLLVYVGEGRIGRIGLNKSLNMILDRAKIDFPDIQNPLIGAMRKIKTGSILRKVLSNLDLRTRKRAGLAVSDLEGFTHLVSLDQKCTELYEAITAIHHNLNRVKKWGLTALQRDIYNANLSSAIERFHLILDEIDTSITLETEDKPNGDELRGQYIDELIGNLGIGEKEFEGYFYKALKVVYRDCGGDVSDFFMEILEAIELKTKTKVPFRASLDFNDELEIDPLKQSEDEE